MKVFVASPLSCSVDKIVITGPWQKCFYYGPIIEILIGVGVAIW